MTANAAARWDEADRRRLQSVLRALYLPLLFLFPRGFAIRADGVALAWESLRGRLVEARRGGHFALNLPLLPLKEALANGHAGDLCIPMFMTIDLFGATARRRVDVFFMLLILRDCGYLGALPRTLAWLLWSAKVRRARRRPLPLPAPSS
jgi:hypothetical protein